MATSGSTNYTSSSYNIISRALRIIGVLGEGEIPNAQQTSTGQQALNDIIKEFEADGMQLWKKTTISISYVAGQASYPIGIGQTINQTAPLKILNAFHRSNQSQNDSPLILFTKDDYDNYTAKGIQGIPANIFYQTPGPLDNTTSEMLGTVYPVPVPDANASLNYTLYLTCSFPLEDIDGTFDNVDFPTFYINSLVWQLASQLSFEYSLPMAERKAIDQKAQYHYEKAKFGDNEEGSIFFQPNWYILDSSKGSL